jgi:hypothetical protein
MNFANPGRCVRFWSAEQKATPDVAPIAAHGFSAKDSMDFDRSRAGLRMFVENTDQPHAKSEFPDRDQAIVRLARLRIIIGDNRHNGSGACRNPVLVFQVVGN